MIELVFYTTSGCHLCDEALAIVEEVHKANPQVASVVQIKLVDIASADELIESFGKRIPVIHICPKTSARGHDELAWPFKHQDYIDFINRTIQWVLRP
jgi:thiol-disulfide isomerase/thioredoxin